MKSGRPVCAEHPERRAAFQCPECRSTVCADCTHHAWASNGFIDRCQACDVPLTQLVTSKSSHRFDQRTYLERIPDVVATLKRPSNLWLMAGLTLLTAPLTGAIIYIMDPALAFMGQVLIFGLEAVAYLTVITQTARGDIDVQPPEFTDIQEDFVRPMLRYLAASLPIVVGVIWFAFESISALRVLDVIGGHPQALFDQPGPALLVVIGIALFPLTSIIAATCYSISAVLNPLLWIHCLRTLGTDYFPAMVVFLGVLGFEIFVWLPWMYELYWQLNIPVLVLAVTTFLSYLPMFLRAHLLGALVAPHYEDLL